MATGQPVGDLLECDESMLATLAEVHEQRWTRSEELLALVAEVVDAAGLRSLTPHLKQGARLPKPLQVPRPGTKQRRTRTTLADLARFTPGGAS